MNQELIKTGSLIIILIILGVGLWWLFDTQEAAINPQFVLKLPAAGIKELEIVEKTGKNQEKVILLQLLC